MARIGCRTLCKRFDAGDALTKFQKKRIRRMLIGRELNRIRSTDEVIRKNRAGQRIPFIGHFFTKRVQKLRAFWKKLAEIPLGGVAIVGLENVTTYGNARAA